MGLTGHILSRWVIISACVGTGTCSVWRDLASTSGFDREAQFPADAVGLRHAWSAAQGWIVRNRENRETQTDSTGHRRCCAVESRLIADSRNTHLRYIPIGRTGEPISAKYLTSRYSYAILGVKKYVYRRPYFYCNLSFLIEPWKQKLQKIAKKIPLLRLLQ